MNNKDTVGFARGVGACLVIMGHMYGISSFCEGIIYSMHMPLFFILSGICFSGNEKYRFSEFVKKKFTSILMPAFFFSILMFMFGPLLKCLLLQSGFLKELVVRFVGIFLQYGPDDFGGTYWFLFCIFLSQIVYYILKKYCSSVFIAFFVVFLYVLGNCYKNFWLPWHAESLSISLIYIYIGDNVHKAYKLTGDMNIKGRKRFVYVCGIIAGFVAGFIVNYYILDNHKYIIVNHSYGNIFLDIVVAYCGSMICIWLSSLLVNKKIGLIVCWIGKNSLVFYCIQSLVTSVANLFLIKTEGINGFKSFLIYFLSFFVITGFVSIGAVLYNRLLKKYIEFTL